MRILILFFILASCAHRPKASLLSVISKDPEATIASLPAKNFSDALRIIQNRHNYLRILFEQSYDPYYGKPKWPLSCLEANDIGKVIQNGKDIYLLSKLVLKDSKEGFCPENTETKSKWVLMIYCKGTDVVKEYKFSASIDFDPASVSYCNHFTGKR